VYSVKTNKLVESTVTAKAKGFEGQYSIKKLESNQEYRLDFVFPVEYCNAEYGANSVIPTQLIIKNRNLSANFGLTNEFYNFTK
jgi:hypothetical protein